LIQSAVKAGDSDAGDDGALSEAALDSRSDASCQKRALINPVTSVWAGLSIAVSSQVVDDTDGDGAEDDESCPEESSTIPPMMNRAMIATQVRQPFATYTVHAGSLAVCAIGACGPASCRYAD
jgi:hypothetical protein